MRLRTINQAGVGPGRLVDLDLREEGEAFALLEDENGKKRFDGLAGLTRHVPMNSLSRLHTIRSVDETAAIVMPIAEITDEPVETCALITPDAFTVLPFGTPADFFVGGGHVFATYTERTLLFTREPSFEGDIVTVFDSSDHSRLFGLADLLTGAREEPTCYEVTSACATAAGELVFVGLGDPHVWTVDAVSRTFTAARPVVPLPSVDLIEAVATNGPEVLVLTTGQDALELITLDRLGNTLSRSSLPAASVFERLGGYASEAPAAAGDLMRTCADSTAVVSSSTRAKPPCC